MKHFYLSTFFFFFTSLILPQNGLVKSTYLTGETESIMSYADQILTGTSYWYYKNGNIKKEITYSNGKVNGWVKEYFETGILKEEYKVISGVRDGLHKKYYSNGGIKEVRSYEGGKLVKLLNVDYDPNYIPTLDKISAGNRQLESQKNDEFICDADLCPEPIGGMNAIYNNLVFPEHARLYGLQGTVKLLAIVDKNGIVEKTEVINGIGLGCDEAASIAVKATRFLPARNNGNNVQSNVILKIDFINESQKEIIATREEFDNSSKGLKVVKVETPQVTNTFDYSTSDENTLDDKTIINTDNTLSAPDLLINTKVELCDLDICPEPIGGIDAILNNFRLPRRAKKNNAAGNIIVLADVDENGYVRTTEILQDIGFGAGIAAEVAVLDTRFKPGYVNGIPKRGKVKVSIPVK